MILYPLLTLNNLLSNIAQIYGITLIGYIAVKANWFNANATDGLLKFVFNFSLPALLFRSLSKIVLPEVLPWKLLASYYLGVCTIFLLGLLFSKLVLVYQPQRQVLFSFAGCFSNTVLLGIPLILQTFGKAGEFPLFLLISFHGLTMFTLVTLCLEFTGKQQETLRENIKWAIKGIFKNPVILGILSGVLFNWFGFDCPEMLDRILMLFEQTAIPCALFSLGATLAGYQISGDIRIALLALFLKNILHPLMVWLLATQVFEISEVWANVAVMLAAMPTGASILLFAHRYQQGLEMVSTTVFLSTFFSMISIPALLFLFGL